MNQTVTPAADRVISFGFLNFVRALAEQPVSYEQLMKAITDNAYSPEVATAVLQKLIAMPQHLAGIAGASVGTIVDFYYILKEFRPGYITLVCRPSFSNMPHNTLVLATAHMSLAERGMVRWLDQIQYTLNFEQALVFELPAEFRIESEPPRQERAARPSRQEREREKRKSIQLVKRPEPRPAVRAPQQRPVTPKEDKFLRNAVKEASTLVAEGQLAPAQAAGPEHPHQRAIDAIARGHAVWFMPVGSGVRMVYCKHHRDEVKIAPDVDVEGFEWGTGVKAEMWELARAMGYHPLGRLHPREQAKLDNSDMELVVVDAASQPVLDEHQQASAAIAEQVAQDLKPEPEVQRRPSYLAAPVR